MKTPTPPTTRLSTKRQGSLKHWLRRHQLAATLIIGAVVVTTIFVIGILSVKYSELPFFQERHKVAPPKFYSALTGVEVADQAATTQPVTGVMIENSPDARPQSGLKGAGVVYEAVAEGGITRFIALYQGNKPQLIGPVRSLRLYYLSWAAPYQASIAHVGGSPNALSAVRGGQYRDIDQFFNAGSYWRARDRYAPHNMYTSGEKLDTLNASKGFTQSQFSSFSRTDGKPAETPNATKLRINFSSALYNTSYAYDAATNSYNRSMAGTPHRDREAGAITPSVIVVLKVSTEQRANNSDGYRDIVTTGSGQAHVFQNGTVTPATWRKDSLTAPLQLTQDDGQPLALVRGQTWVAAITEAGSVSWE